MVTTTISKGITCQLSSQCSFCEYPQITLDINKFLVENAKISGSSSFQKLLQILEVIFSTRLPTINKICFIVRWRHFEMPVA